MLLLNCPGAAARGIPRRQMEVFALDPIRGSTFRSELPKLGNSTIGSANLFKEAEGMGLLSFFGSAQVNFKMPQRKTFSIATTQMRMTTIVTAVGVELAMKSLPEQRNAVAITNHYQLFRCDSRSFLFRRAAGF
jgi:hypothetical protein